MRGFEPEDDARLVELDADPEVRRYLGGVPPTTLSEACAWRERLVQMFPTGSHRGFWAAEAAGSFIGWFHLRPARDTGEAELGYRLRRDYWGRGLATEGSRALIDLARAEREPKVIARTLVDNLASRRVMEKVGMVPVREFLYDGRLASIEYAIELLPETRHAA